MDRREVGSENSHEEEITEEPMDEEASSDAESEGSAMTDTTLGGIAPSSQESGWLEDPLDLGHLAGGDSGAELPSVQCGGLDTPMVDGNATPVAHKEQRKTSQDPLLLCHPPQTVQSGRMSLLQRCPRMPPPSLTKVIRRSSAMPWR